MILDIVTPEQTVFSGEVISVTVPGAKGRFTILEHHAPIISGLCKGEISYRTADDRVQVVGASGGFVEVSNNRVSIAIETADE